MKSVQEALGTLIELVEISEVEIPTNDFKRVLLRAKLEQRVSEINNQFSGCVLMINWSALQTNDELERHLQLLQGALP